MLALVTGATGFVAPYLIKELLAQSFDVVSTYNTSLPQHFQTDFPTVEFRSLDICDFEKVRSLFFELKPDVVFHLAAISSFKGVEKNFKSSLTVNVAATDNILKVLADLEKADPKKYRLIFTSSSEVYGVVDPNQKVNEVTPTEPKSLYGLTKLMAELALERRSRCLPENSKVSTIISRSFNHSGAGQANTFVLPAFAEQIAEIKSGNTPSKIKVGNLTAVRDFLHVKDVVKAYVAMANLTSSEKLSRYNVCSGVGVKISSILEELLNCSGVKPEIIQDPERMRPSENPVVIGDYSKLCKASRWRPTVSTEDLIWDVYSSFAT